MFEKLNWNLPDTGDTVSPSTEISLKNRETTKHVERWTKRMRVKANGWMLPLTVMRRRTGENQSLASVSFLQVFVGMCVLDGGSGSLDPLSGWFVGGDLLTFGRFNKNSREIFNWKSPIHLKNLKHFVWDVFKLLLMNSFLFVHIYFEDQHF